MSSTSTASVPDVTENRTKFTNSKSFTRLPSPPRDRNARSRSSTLQTTTIPEIPSYVATLSSSPPDEKPTKPDIFSNPEDAESTTTADDEVTNPNLRIPQSFDELPIELRSLTERYDQHLFGSVARR